MRRAVSGLILLLVAGVVGGCAGEDPNVTESGKGKPVVTVTFPAETTTASEHEAEITVHNPGPGDMRSIVVAFASVGPRSGQREMPIPIVAFGAKGENPSVMSIEPEPTAISPDGVLFTFGPRCPDGGAFPADCQGVARDDAAPRIAAGETITLVFTLRVPVLSGVAANSVQVYDGAEVDRAGGARLETVVGR